MPITINSMEIPVVTVVVSDNDETNIPIKKLNTGTTSIIIIPPIKSWLHAKVGHNIIMQMYATYTLCSGAAACIYTYGMYAFFFIVGFYGKYMLVNILSLYWNILLWFPTVYEHFVQQTSQIKLALRAHLYFHDIQRLAVIFLSCRLDTRLVLCRPVILFVLTINETWIYLYIFVCLLNSM